MDPWIAEAAQRIAARAPEELARLVGVSSPSGDVAGAEEAFDVAIALAPAERARGARCVLVGRSRRRPDRHAGGHGRRAHRAARPRRHGPLARRPPRAGARRRAPRRRGLGRHEGRRRARARRPARAGAASRALRRGRAAARLRRGMARRRVRPRGPLRGLGRLPVLRGRRADAGRSRTPSSSSARPPGPCASSRTGARRTRAPRPRRAPTRCWPWPARRRRWPPATTRRATPI